MTASGWRGASSPRTTQYYVLSMKRGEFKMWCLEEGRGDGGNGGVHAGEGSSGLLRALLADAEVKVLNLQKRARVSLSAQAGRRVRRLSPRN